MLNSTVKNFSSFLAVILFAFSFSTIYSQEITPLDSLKTNDSDGVTLWAQAPSVNVTGIVTSTIEIGTGTAGPGTIQDSKTGIAIYGNFFASSGGVKIGDSVVVTDVKVVAYNGLTELSYNSTSAVQIISSDHTVIPAEIKINEFSTGWNSFEKYESMLVKVKNVVFTDTASTFSLNGKSGWNYHITDGVDTMLFRIVKNTPDLIGQPIPKTPVDIVGIVSQYDSSQPYNSGYEIFPLGASSISAATDVEAEPSIPTSFQVYQNYPNPFNPTTNISFSVPSAQHVEVTVYDMIGRKVSTLFNGTAPAGITKVKFNGQELSSGVYIYSVKTNTNTISKKLVLMK